jgi:hypothetical protein
MNLSCLFISAIGTWQEPITRMSPSIFEQIQPSNAVEGSAQINIEGLFSVMYFLKASKRFMAVGILNKLLLALELVNNLTFSGR